MAEPFEITSARFYNSAQGGKILAHSGSYEQYLYGTDQDYVTAYPAKDRPIHPQYGQLQTAVVCSSQSGLIVVDVDHPELFADSETGKLLTPAQCWSFRGDHFHIAIDAREYRERWVVQGPTEWGDVKSNGFVPLPGSQHYSGDTYADLSGGHPETRIVPMTDELRLALIKDRAGYEHKAGIEGANGHDGALASLCFDLYLQGKNEEEIREAWDEASEPNDPSWPFDDADFARHMRNVPSKAAPILAEWEEDERSYLEMFPDKDWSSVALADRGETREGNDEWEVPKPPELGKKDPAAEEALAQRLNAPVVTGDAEPETPTSEIGPEESAEDKESYSFFSYCGLARADAFDPPGADTSITWMAESVLRAIRPSVVYDSEGGKWLRRAGDHWMIEPGEKFPAGVVRKLYWVMPYGDKEPDSSTMSFAEAAHVQAQFARKGMFDKQTQAVATAMEQVAQFEHPSSVRLGDLDASPTILWAGGVPWDLERSQGKLVRAQIPYETPHIRTASYYPDLSVETPLWDNLLETILPDPSLRSWAIRVLAVCLTGYSEAVLPMLIGSAGRGKTALMTLLMNLLGSYAHSARSDLVDPKAYGSAEYSEFELKGRRLSFFDEAPQPGRQAQRKLKALTGGGTRAGRQAYGKIVEFKATHTFVMTANRGEDDPILSDEAVRRRVRPIPFEADKDAVTAAMRPIGYESEGFKPAWRKEAPGVLAKLILEAAAYINDPDSVSNEQAPMASQMLTADIISDQDTVLLWFEDETEPYEPGTKASQLRDAYMSWSRSQGVYAEDRSKFKKRLCELCGITEPPRKASGIYYPIRLKQGEGWPGIPSPGTPASASATPPVAQQKTGNPPQAKNSAPASAPSPPPSRPEPNDPKAHLRAILDKAKAPDWATGGLVEGSAGTDLLDNGYVVPAGDSALASMAHVHDQSCDGGRIPLTEDELAQMYEEINLNPVPDPKTGVEALGVVDTPEPQPIELIKSKRKPAQSPEEKAAAAAEKKRLAAEDRERKRQEKIAEVGGRIITLPAIVNRNLEIRECSVEEAKELLSLCLNELSVDVEHSGFGIGHKHYRLRLVQLGNEFAAVVLDPHDSEQADVIRWAMAEAKELHAHNASADLLPLEHAGLCDDTSWDRMTDTLNLSKLVDPALSDSDEAALKPLARNLLGEDYALSWKCEKEKAKVNAAGGWLTQTTPNTPLEKSGWAMIPVCEVFVKYAASDILDCSAVARVLSENLLRIYGSAS